MRRRVRGRPAGRRTRGHFSGRTADSGRLKRRCKTTIRWAVDRLKQDYFTKDPSHIIDIWLFKDKASYRKHCRAFWNQR